MGSAMSMCGQKVSPVTNVGCEKAPGHDGPHGVLFGASPVTSPRTLRQVLGWTVPDHIESGTIGRWVNVTCRHGVCLGTPSASRSYYVPAMSVAAESAPFEVFLRSHAHGGEVTNALAPLSEVLPETPEPPREDEEHDDLADVPLEDHGTWTKRQAVTRRDEAERGAERCYFEGCPEWITGSSDYCPEHAKLYAPVPASQSVPAVAVSSTEGKETGEAAEDAQGAAEADWTEESRFADFREAYDYATIHFSAAIRAHAKVDRREAYQIWHTIQLGMEKIQRERSPLPDSETEWGVRAGSNDIPTRTDEDNARHIATFGGGLTAVSRQVGPWIEVTS